MTPAPSRRLFAYGTLEIPEVVEALAGRPLPGEDAVLPGYARFLLRGQPYPGVLAREGAETTGRLYDAVDDETLALVDRFEGEPYQRLSLPVQTLAGSTHPAETYVIPPRLGHLLCSETWDRERFIARHLGETLLACRELRRAAGRVR